MAQLHWMSVFVSVADTGNFAEAGRRLGLSPPAVTRAIASLEEKLGVQLFKRTTRLVRLTEAGERYLDDSRRILADLEEANESAAGISSTPRGHLHVSASVLFGAQFVIPLLIAYLERHPAVTVHTSFVDRNVSLLEEGIDVALRIGELPDSSLRAVKVGEVRQVLVGAPAYIANHGEPIHPEALKHHRIVCARGITPNDDWRFHDAGRALSVRVVPHLVVNTNDSAIAATAAGGGLCKLLSYQVATALGAGTLVRMLTEFEPPPLPVHIVHLDGRRPTAKLRAFIDLAVDRLRVDPALNGEIVN